MCKFPATSDGKHCKIKKWLPPKERIKSTAGRIQLKDKAESVTLKLFVQTSDKITVVTNSNIQSHKSPFKETKVCPTESFRKQVF